MLVSTALVLLMTPSLALFYGGLVRRKNVLSTFMHCFFALGLVTVQWVVIGYSLAFGPTRGGLVGGFDHVLLEGVGLEPHGTIPHLLFCAYQLMFAIITPALIAGAFAERLKFSAYVAFTLAWTTLVYDPICHWVWAPGGWLGARGALDFAGGTVVHLSSGASALVFAIVLGKRHGYPRQKMLPHDLTMTLLGAGLLWFGWFGFNAGSALASNELAVLALVNTHVAAGAGALVWAGIEWARHGKPSALGVASGLVAGLVAITPAAGFVGPVASMAIGAMAGGACFGGVLLKGRFGYDDALDAFGVHGLGGALGAVLTGVFASTVWNPGARDGALYGGWDLFAENVLGVVVAAAYAGGASFVLLKAIDRVIGLRPDKDTELEGLDVTLHGEEAYSAMEGSMKREPSEAEEASRELVPSEA
ncbi:MAG: ammonium transporter [Sandaracinaceae bacterium]|nr:ammonium transporter [Sandaracinaceae bacterium]